MLHLSQNVLRTFSEAEIKNYDVKKLSKKLKHCIKEAYCQCNWQRIQTYVRSFIRADPKQVWDCFFILWPLERKKIAKKAGSRMVLTFSNREVKTIHTMIQKNIHTIKNP